MTPEEDMKISLQISTVGSHDEQQPRIGKTDRQNKTKTNNKSDIFACPPARPLPKETESEPDACEG